MRGSLRLCFNIIYLIMKKIRIILAAVFIIGITLLFTGVGTSWWAWMAKLQFLPAVLGFNLAVIAGILALTLLVGRIYCSVICPLGVFQDIVIALRRKWGSLVQKRHMAAVRKAAASGKPVPKHKPAKASHYKKEKPVLRYGVLALTIVCIATGLQGVVLLIAPYSAYGRMVALAAGKTLAWPLILVAALTFVVIVLLAWTSGRSWCNDICPVGTTLSLVSRFSLFRIGIDKEECIGCMRCEHVCKSSCIDIKGGKIVDNSRCVDCFDCTEVCETGAIALRFGGKAGNSHQENRTSVASEEKPASDSSRRDFIGKGAMLAGGLVLSDLESRAQVLNGGMAAVKPKQDPSRETPLVPPGAKSVKSFYDKCTACQLCVSNCPNDVLKTGNMLQPYMSYADGYCRPECNVCGTLCPAGAITPLVEFEKLSISWGTAHVSHEECLQSQGVKCLNCIRHCPVGAIRTVTVTREDGTTLLLPVVNEELCIGCGACENLCPVRPVSAVRVNGRSRHQTHE